MVLAILALLPFAAKAEVTECKVIAALPAVIDSSGVWCLKQNLSWGGTGLAIEIQRSFVTLDLNRDIRGQLFDRYSSLRFRDD